MAHVVSLQSGSHLPHLAYARIVLAALGVWLVGFLAAMGWQQYQNHRPLGDYQSQPVTAAETTPVQKTAAAIQAPRYTLYDGAQLISASYQQYIHNAEQQPDITQRLGLLHSALTTGLYTQLAGVHAAGQQDAVVCSSALPLSYTITTTNQSQNIGQYVVNEAFGTAVRPVTVSVDLSQLRISAIKCD